MKKTITYGLAALLSGTTPVAAQTMEDDLREAFFGDSIAQVEEAPLQESSLDLSGVLNTTFKNVYDTRAGFIPNKDGVSQNLALLTLGTDSGNFSAGYWNNIDLGEGKIFEQDVFVTYAAPSIETALGTVTPRLSVQLWDFPQADQTDYIVEPGVSLSNDYFNFDATFTLPVAGDNTDGYMIHGTLSKPFELTDDLTLTPYVKAAFLGEGFYGAEGGLSQITAGVDVSYKITDNLELYGGIGYQEGFNGMEDQEIITGGIRLTF